MLRARVASGSFAASVPARGGTFSGLFGEPRAEAVLAHEASDAGAASRRGAAPIRPPVACAADRPRDILGG